MKKYIKHISILIALISIFLAVIYCAPNRKTNKIDINNSEDKTTIDTRKFTIFEDCKADCFFVFLNHLDPENNDDIEWTMECLSRCYDMWYRLPPAYRNQFRTNKRPTIKDMSYEKYICDKCDDYDVKNDNKDSGCLNSNIIH